MSLRSLLYNKKYKRLKRNLEIDSTSDSDHQVRDPVTETLDFGPNVSFRKIGPILTRFSLIFACGAVGSLVYFPQH